MNKSILKKLFFTICFVIGFSTILNFANAAEGDDIGKKCSTDGECSTDNCETYCVANSKQHCVNKYGGKKEDWRLPYLNVRNYCHNKTIKTGRAYKRPEPKRIGETCTKDIECKSQTCSSSKLKGKNKKVCTCSPEQDYGGNLDCERRYDLPTKNSDDWRCAKGSTQKGDGYPYCFSLKPGDENYYATKNSKKVTTSEKIQPEEEETVLDEKKIISPGPEIKIPGLDFTESSSLTTTRCGIGSCLVIPYLGEYLSAVYNWSMIAASTLAVLMIIISGIQWIAPSFSGSQNHQKAKDRIIKSISGLILIASSYVILFTINPELVKFDNLKVRIIERKTISQVTGDLTSDLNPNGSQSIRHQSEIKIPKGIVTKPFSESKDSFTNFNQFDSRWGEKELNTAGPGTPCGTIGSSGCGYTSLAMIINAAGYSSITPPQIASYLTAFHRRCDTANENNRGDYCTGCGNYHSMFFDPLITKKKLNSETYKKAANSMPAGVNSQVKKRMTNFKEYTDEIGLKVPPRGFNLNVEYLTPSQGDVNNALKEGKVVIAGMSKSPWTNGGHFIVIVGINKDGTYVVNDPGNNSNAEGICGDPSGEPKKRARCQQVMSEPIPKNGFSEQKIPAQILFGNSSWMKHAYAFSKKE